ncbi:WbqC family protein [Flavimarina sp. Hel_I_48]|uniref:WbqC family protein n=1 Tax=Flavimarina sp. Hel_I_48 TaxID=1392488 RepID=UPI0004DEDCD5|nr:WbqC family protein [Flavimarina sp. Hel_I_48]
MKNILIIPTYLPSITTMAHIAQADQVVFELKDNYQKQSYRNRTYINTANGSLGLTIPIRHNQASGHKKTSDALIENNFLWQRQHWRSIQIAYRSSPFFEFYEDDLAPLYTTGQKFLQEFNLKSIKLLLNMMEISKNIEFTTSYEQNPKLLNRRALANAKNKNTFVAIPKYDQVFADTTGFNPQVSILDLIFNEGPNSKNFLNSIELGLGQGG